MIVYHGSNHNFKTLRIRKNLIDKESTLLNEGAGIYFSTNIETARSYGKYIYVLDIQDVCLFDFRNYTVCETYVDLIRANIIRNYDIDIYDYMNIEPVCLRLQNGALAISCIGRELYLSLDACEHWYENTQTAIQRVYRYLRQCDRNCPKAYLFQYHIPDIGVIKDVSPQVVKIIEKQRSY